MEEEWHIYGYQIAGNIENLLHGLTLILNNLLITLCLAEEPERVRSKLLPSLMIEDCNEYSEKAKELNQEFTAWVKDIYAEEGALLEYGQLIEGLNLAQRASIYVSNLTYMIERKKIKK